jgi:hypothetical protein
MTSKIVCTGYEMISDRSRVVRNDRCDHERTNITNIRAIEQSKKL